MKPCETRNECLTQEPQASATVAFNSQVMKKKSKYACTVKVYREMSTFSAAVMVCDNRFCGQKLKIS